jgi:hypothetical protein
MELIWTVFGIATRNYRPILRVVLVRKRNICTITGLYRFLGFQEAEASRLLIQSAHEVRKVVSPKHRPPLPPMRNSWYSFTRIRGLVEPSTTVRPEGLSREFIQVQYRHDVKTRLIHTGPV